jgi:hypothetical protein
MELDINEKRMLIERISRHHNKLTSNREKHEVIIQFNIFFTCSSRYPDVLFRLEEIYLNGERPLLVFNSKLGERTRVTLDNLENWVVQLTLAGSCAPKDEVFFPTGGPEYAKCENHYYETLKNAGDKRIKKSRKRVKFRKHRRRTGKKQRRV